MRILLIEDDLDLAENIVAFFESYGWAVDYAINGEQGLKLLSHGSFDAVILDITLPGINGFEVCSRLRRNLHANVPVLMLTARGQLEDKIKGFEAGTDDYLAKPFALKELQMRIDALLRRGRHDLPQRLTAGDLTLDLVNGTASRDGDEILLPRVSFQILKCLLENYPQTVSRRELEYVIWGDTPPDTDALKAHFYTLRQLIDRPYPFSMLETVRGIGYRICTES